MGRQVEVEFSESDEAALLAFLRSSGQIQIYRSFAPSAGGLLVESFEPRGDGNWHYDIWNRAFAWEPTYSPTTTVPVKWYISNKSAAPLLEYTRHNEHARGRIYWAKHFAAREKLAYDAEAFERWYDSVVRWVRKHSGSAL